MPRMKVPKKLLPLIQKPKRFKILFGGRGGAKSMTVADICIMDAQTKGIKTACFREYQNSIDDSVHALLSNEINRLGANGFEVLTSSIRYQNTDVFKFRGLARNPEGVKSMHGFKRFWVEEARTISFESLKNLTPTLREEGSEIWMTANLGSKADPFSQRFFVPYEKELRRDGYYEDDLHLIIWINMDDNPFAPEVLKQEREHDRKTMSAALFRHVWEGEFYDEVDDSIIPVEWFEAAIDAHEKLGFAPEGAIVAAHDPSDTGPDPKGYALRHGSVFLDVREEAKGDVNEGLDWAMAKAFEARADYFVWDGDGMGAALQRSVDKKLDSKHMSYFMFKGSESPEDPDGAFLDIDGDNFKSNKESLFNKRAQYSHRLMMRFYNTWRAVTQGIYTNPDELISISSTIKQMDELRAQVCRVPRKRNNNGKFQIVSKVDMQKKPYQLPSPNMYDSMMMAMYQPDIVSNEEFTFEGWG